MSSSVMIEPTTLFNIINQENVYPNISDPNYLLLVDARTDVEYDEGHIVLARRSRKTDLGHFFIPYDSQLECKTHVVVYDGNCKSTQCETDPAYVLANLFAEEGSKNPVKILRGGYEHFSALYPFLRTQKIIYMPRELDEFQTYPCEIIQGMLYVGSNKHATNDAIFKHLNIDANLHLTTDTKLYEKEISSKCENSKLINIADNKEANLIEHSKDINNFISINRKQGRTVLISSDNGKSRNITACLLYIMKYYSWTLQQAWIHMKQCKENFRPNRNFVAQLSNYEEEILGKKVTDISDPNY